MNTTTHAKVRMVNAALDRLPGEESAMIMRGVIDQESLHLLKTAPYQREVAPAAQLGSLIKAFRAGDRVPDIELGFRRSGLHHDKGSGQFILDGETYTIDGLQRVSAALIVLKETPKTVIRLGAAVRLDTTEAWERDRFRVLNVDRSKLSPNILLRNLNDELPVVRLLRALSDDPNSVLHGRICWAQRPAIAHILSALNLMKVVGSCHAHLGAGRHSQYEDLARGLNAISAKIGADVFTDNIQTFFDLVEECWGIRNVVRKEQATWLRTNFLSCLAMLFAEHTDFWRDNDTRLFVEKELRNKLQKLPIDAHMKDLAGSGGTARNILYQVILAHVNSGKRTRRLTARNPPDVSADDGQDPGDGTADLGAEPKDAAPQNGVANAPTASSSSQVSATQGPPS